MNIGAFISAARVALLLLASFVLFHAVTNSFGVVERAALLAMAGLLAWTAYRLQRRVA